MTLWFHSTILATSLAATVAVGLASAAIYSDADGKVAAKADRLPVGAGAETTYLIFETRNDGVSVLTRVPVTGPVTGPATELN
jgi:hypothetical protein